jgi:hypothetical protein
MSIPRLRFRNTFMQMYKYTYTHTYLHTKSCPSLDSDSELSLSTCILLQAWRTDSRILLTPAKSSSACFVSASSDCMYVCIYVCMYYSRKTQCFLVSVLLQNISLLKTRKLTVHYFASRKRGFPLLRSESFWPDPKNKSPEFEQIGPKPRPRGEWEEWLHATTPRLRT